MKSVDNRGMKSNAKGFNKGQIPPEFGPNDIGTGSEGEKNIIGGIPRPNNNKNKTYDASLLKPRDPVLNAVPMPNKNKKNTKDYSVLKGSGDGSGDGAPGTNTIGGTPKPNKIS